MTTQAEPGTGARQACLAWRSRDPALAEELAQETLLYLARGLPGLRAEVELRARARRLSSDVWRDRQRQRAPAAAEDAVSMRELLDALDPLRPTLGGKARAGSRVGSQ